MNVDIHNQLEKIKEIRKASGGFIGYEDPLIQMIEAAAAEVKRWEEEARTWRSPQQILRLDAEARCSELAAELAVLKVAADAQRERANDAGAALEIITEDYKELCVTAENRQARIEALEGCVRLDRKAFDDLAHGCSFRETEIEKAVYERSRTAVKRIDALLTPVPSAEPRKIPPGGWAAARERIERFCATPDGEDPPELSVEPSGEEQQDE